MHYNAPWSFAKSKSYDEAYLLLVYVRTVAGQSLLGVD